VVGLRPAQVRTTTAKPTKTNRLLHHGQEGIGSRERAEPREDDSEECEVLLGGVHEAKLAKTLGDREINSRAEAGKNRRGCALFKQEVGLTNRNETLGNVYTEVSNAVLPAQGSDTEASSSWKEKSNSLSEGELPREPWGDAVLTGADTGAAALLQPRPVRSMAKGAFTWWLIVTVSDKQTVQ
jgi:hypothetical protein